MNHEAAVKNPENPRLDKDLLLTLISEASVRPQSEDAPSPGEGPRKPKVSGDELSRECPPHLQNE